MHISIERAIIQAGSRLRQTETQHRACSILQGYLSPEQSDKIHRDIAEESDSVVRVLTERVRIERL